MVMPCLLWSLLQSLVPPEEVVKHAQIEVQKLEAQAQAQAIAAVQVSAAAQRAEAEAQQHRVVHAQVAARANELQQKAVHLQVRAAAVAVIIATDKDLDATCGSNASNKLLTIAVADFLAAGNIVHWL